MKIIFLDFDGVLNSAASFHMESRKLDRTYLVNETLCHVCCSNLQYILDMAPDVKVVLSTYWRELYDMDWLKAKLESYGIDSSRVIDKTPIDLLNGRGAEIQAWLELHPEVQDQFVIIDDNDDGISDIFGKSGLNTSNFVQTSWLNGMEISHAVRALKILGEDDSMRGLPI